VINHCVNPDCRAEFKVFSTGNLYALEKRSADTVFFWLCSTCAPKIVVGLAPTGSVTVKPRSDHTNVGRLAWRTGYGSFLALQRIDLGFTPAVPEVSRCPENFGEEHPYRRPRQHDLYL
jgi:hypothetical protein